MLVTLAVWLGTLIFFPIVAQTAFASLPSHSAGLVVRGSLLKLHYMAFVCGLVFITASVIYNRVAVGRTRMVSAEHILVVAMLALTAISQFHLIPRMDALQASAGEVSTLPATAAVRTQFDSLHQWSTRIEGTVLILGLVVLYRTSRRGFDRT